MKNKKAEQAYKESMQEIESLISSIKSGLKTNHKQARAEGIHWGHAGTLSHYAAQLREIENSIHSKSEYAETGNVK